MGLEDLAAGTQGREFTDDDLVQYTVSLYDHVKDETRLIRSKWDDSWSAFNNNFTKQTEEKAEWQSKNYIPKFKMSVRVMSSILKQTIIKADKFFGFRGLNDQSREVEKDVDKTLLRLLDQIKFKQKKFPHAVHLGLLENLMIFKTYVRDIRKDEVAIHEDQQFVFPVDVVSAYDLFLDTTGRNKFLIHRIKMDLSEFKQLVRDGVYERDALDRDWETNC